MEPREPIGGASQGRLEHAYGPRVHVFDHAGLNTLLARIGGNDVRHPELPMLVRSLYQALLFEVLRVEFPRVLGSVPTRMAAIHPREGVYRGEMLDPATRVVLVDVIRAGIVPAQACFELLTTLLPPENVRIDHLTLSRRANERGEVVGVDLHGSKIGGRVDDALLLLPDPMGATGATTRRVLSHYREHWGTPARVIAMPMIATPEYLRAVLVEGSELKVYTTRIDRGLSPAEVLAQRPGADWARERGLNEHGYIVPGAGGMGEVLNNAWC